MALVSKTFSEIITFTRASTGSYFDSAGVLTSAAINAPRLDYNPSTLAAQGLLIEEQRTNVCLQSAALNTTPWTVVGGNASINANTTIAPDGTTTGDSLIPNTTPAVSHLITQSSIGGLDRATQRVISVFVKLAGYQGIRIQDNAFSANFTRGFFNLSTLTASAVQNGNGVASNATITNVGNGWYRCSYISTPNTVTGGGSDLTIAVIDTGTNDVFAGDGTSGVVLWGCQVEAGAFPTSYIPTTTAAVTRSADVASVNTLSPWYNQTEGTIYAELQSLSPLTSAQSVALGKYPHVWQIEAGASDSALWWYGVNSEIYISTTYNNIGTVPSGVNKFAVSLAASGGQSRSSLNGAAAVNRNGTLTGTATLFSLGKESTNGANNFLNGWLRRVTYYPRAFSAAELPVITA